MADHEIGPKEEYQSLRQELLESKRYVFERPLLIAAAGVAALSAFKDVQAAAVPLVITGLLLFNLWFTVNRLYSAGRIVAYIQVQLEKEQITPWKGWETSLREYRKWIKRPGASDTVDSEMDQEAVPDALLYYPAIHQLHVGIALLAVTSSSFIFSQAPSPASTACLVATVLLIAWFTVYAVRYRPEKMRTTIERNRVIWTHVFREMSNPAAQRHPVGRHEVMTMSSDSKSNLSGDSRKNWPGALMFGLLYPAVLGTFFYSLLPETLQALRAPLQMTPIQGTKLLLSFLLIVHFLIDFYLTQQVALETQDYPTATFVLDLLIVLALFVAYDTVHLDDKGVEPEVRWTAGAMFASYVLFRIWGRKMRPVIGRRYGLGAYEIVSAVAFLLVALAWPKAYTLAVVLLGSALLMWFVGAPIVDEFHRTQHKDKEAA